MELWAAIDLLGGSAVTLVQGRADERTVWEESPLQLARRWQDEGADGLHIIDLDAAFGTGSNGETIRAVIRESGVPVQVGDHRDERMEGEPGDTDSRGSEEAGGGGVQEPADDRRGQGRDEVWSGRR